MFDSSVSLFYPLYYGNLSGPPAGGGAGKLSGFGPNTSYDPTNTGPSAAGGPTVPTPPANISNPSTGRETPDTRIEFLASDGWSGAVGAAQQLLDQSPALLQFNKSHSKDVVSGGAPRLRLPGGYVMYFENDAAVTSTSPAARQPLCPAPT